MAATCPYWVSNNDPGFATEPRVREASMDAVRWFRTSCTGSRLQNGALEPRIELENRLASFVGKDSALVFGTGYQVNLGVISCLVDNGDVIAADKEDRVGDLEPTPVAWKRLFEAGIYTNAFVLPGAPEGKSLLRTSCMATHTDE